VPSLARVPEVATPWSRSSLMLHTHTHNTWYKEYIYWTRTHIWNIEMASIWSSDSRWGKCRATFAIYLESFVRSESNILMLATTPVEIFFNSHAQATKKFKWSVLKLVSSISPDDVLRQWPYTSVSQPRVRGLKWVHGRLWLSPQAPGTCKLLQCPQTIITLLSHMTFILLTWA